MRSNLYKTFTSDPWYHSAFCQIKVIMKIHNRQFHQYSICGCQVKIFKLLHTYAASMKWPFMDFFGPLLPQIRPDFTEIFTRDSVLGDKNSVSIILQTLEFLQNRMDTKFAHLVQPWPSHFPLIMVKIEKNKYYGKTSALQLSKYAKIQTLSFLPFK